MAERSQSGRRSCGAVVAFCAAIVPAAAIAQTTPTDRIEAIERQLRSLQSEVQQLKGELGAEKQQLRQARSAAQPARQASAPMRLPASAGSRPRRYAAAARMRKRNRGGSYVRSTPASTSIRTGLRYANG